MGKRWVSPEHGENVKYFTDSDEDLNKKKEEKKDTKSPRVTWRHVTHSVHRETAYVTRICAHVTDAAAVTVFLHSRWPTSNVQKVVSGRLVTSPATAKSKSKSSRKKRTCKQFYPVPILFLLLLLSKTLYRT